ncbi:hypothetical protein H4S07_002264, partial [Coemansia furcata]
MATYKTLSSSLNWSTGLPPPSTTLLAGTLGSDSSVLIPHFISSALDNKMAVTLVSFTQTYSHYAHILRKMGVNAQSLQFVNALIPADLSSLPPATRPHYTLGEWPEFFAWLAERPPGVVIIDGLCSLLDQGRDAQGFFAGCQRIVEAQKGRLVVNMFVDDENSELLAHAVVRRSHYVLSCAALASGASNDVSGQLTA